MRTLILPSFAIAVAACLLARPLFADSPSKRDSQREEEVAVFVTGSLIPQRVKVRRIGTKTQSPLRVIDRGEIDKTGRFTTPGSLVNEASMRVIGH